MNWSFQLYSARNARSWSGVLTDLAALGYREVEGYGDVYADPKAFRAELDRNGLAMPTGHFSIDSLEEDFKGAVRTAKALGIKLVICPWLEAEDRPSDAAGWQAFGERLAEVGRKARAAGLDFAWHNHDFEFTPLPDGTVPMRIILAAAPDIGWEMDVAWVIRGGQDPFAWIDEFGKRIVAVHVKDIAPAGEAVDEDGWADVGHGTVAWKALFKAFRRGTPASHFVMEHDNPADLLRFARRSIKTVKRFKQRTPARKLGVGVIGCGNISTTYFSLAPLFRGIEMRACADINPQAAEARAAEYGLRAETVDGLLASDDIDIVVNLTIPAVHYEVSRRAIEAGKHVYSEKPFVLSVSDGLDLKKRADKRGLRIGSAPDTFLGGSHQLVRSLIDAGELGKITGGTCFVMSHGMEDWHPNPDFFFQPGAGPVLDVGPYYVANLIQLLGPVRRVTALASSPQTQRTILNGPRSGEKIAVGTPTTVHGVLDFFSGALVTLNCSWDVWENSHEPMELYGEKGTVHVPDPNFFGGPVRYTRGAKSVKKLPRWKHPFSRENQQHPHGMMANYRTAGLADMAMAILEGRPHRCSMDMALHAIDVMTGLLKSAESGRVVTMKTSCDRPAALGVEEAKALLSSKD